MLKLRLVALSVALMFVALVALTLAYAPRSEAQSSPSISLSVSNNTLYQGDSTSVTVSASNLRPSRTYGMKVETDNRNIGFSDTCSSTIRFATPFSSSRSYTLYGCSTPGGTVTATLLDVTNPGPDPDSVSGASTTVATASEYVTVVEPTPTPTDTPTPIPPPPDTSPTLPNVSNRSYTTGQSISLQLPSASGGDGTLSYMVEDLPGCLSFSSATRTISGTCNAAGSWEVTYSVQDADGDPDSKKFTITVTTTPPPDTSPTLPNVSDQSYTTGQSISLQLPSASGGDGTLRYSVSGRPGCLSFSSATRTISGTCSAAGIWTLTYTVRDKDQDTDSKTFTITISTIPPPPPKKLPTPQNVVANGHRVDGKISLTWDAVTGAGRYKLRYKKVTCSADSCFSTAANWTIVPGLSTTNSDKVAVDDDTLYWIQVQAFPGGPPASSIRESLWSSEDLFYANDGPPRATRLLLQESYPPTVATAPIWGYQPKNASGEHEFKFIVCGGTIPAGVTHTVQDIADAIETWETSTGGLVKMTRRNVASSSCDPPKGILPTGDNEVVFAGRFDIDVALCINAPACIRVSTWDWLLARSEKGLVEELPKIVEGTILMWYRPSKGKPASDWSVPDSNGCSRLVSTVIHEAGHILGIGWPPNDHPTIKTDSIMSAGYAHHKRYCTPQLYDIVAIEANYQSR